MSERATFTRLDEMTVEDMKILRKAAVAIPSDPTGTIMQQLRLLEGVDVGLPVDRLTHCLQTATRAYRDGADDEMVVCALIHDIGDALDPANHAALAAEILRPYVSPERCAIVRYHTEFQGWFWWAKIGRDHTFRDRHRDQPWFDEAHNFCERWDMRAFDPNYPTETLSFFEPILHRIFGEQRTFGGSSSDPASLTPP